MPRGIIAPYIDATLEGPYGLFQMDVPRGYCPIQDSSSTERALERSFIGSYMSAPCSISVYADVPGVPEIEYVSQTFRATSNELRSRSEFRKRKIVAHSVTKK